MAGAITLREAELLDSLAQALQANSPRFSRPATPLPSLLIHGGVLLLWMLLLVNAFTGHRLAGWSIGIVYIFYDTILLVFTFWKTLPLRHAAVPPERQSRPSLAVIIAAYNEAAVLAGTIAALAAQSDPPDEIILADDGSTDATAAMMFAAFALPPPPLGGISPVSDKQPQLRWLRLPHGGKARALNQAITHINSALMLTVDADTKLAPDAIAAMRAAFAVNPGLVAVTGVLTPVCGGSLSGRLFEWFQTYEYIRNFLSRYAWASLDSLLLISGAFAGFRRDAVLRVGGFDPDCMVEDYELIHRLRRYGYDHDLGWHSTVLGTARARTSAPAAPLSFLRQRRRWFGGFLQTQLWYRHMVGAAKYQDVGLLMLPVKAVDTMQPIFGLCAFVLLLWYIFTGKIGVLIPVGGFIIGKIILDLAFHLWSIHLYRRWTGGDTKANFGLAIVAAVAEPFSFQLLRHLGASWGWAAFLSGRQRWSAQNRQG